MIRLENLNEYKINRNIICIDLKSFYASVECVLRGLDPFETPLVVADQGRGDGSIVLAVTPYLKSKGVPSRLRIFELPKDIKIIFARPQMHKYMEYATKIIGIFLEFVSEEDLYVYSIDETFIDLTNYLKYYNKTDYEIVEDILNAIKTKLGLYATCGIGPNMLLAKLSLDIEAKNNDNGIAKWRYEDVETKLWPVSPLSKMWGIGKRMERKLNLMGLTEIGDIAKYNKEKLKKKFGVLGLELWYHTNGIDMSLIQDKKILRNKPKSYGLSQVLFRDYNAEEILTIILEMTDEVTSRLRLSKKRAKTISLFIGYNNDYGEGFSRQLTLEQPTANEFLIYETCINIFDSFYEGFPIRKVGISLSNLDETRTYQYSLFEDVEKIDREIKLKASVDKIKLKHGKNYIVRAVSNEEHATAKKRNKLIGGHHV